LLDELGFEPLDWQRRLLRSTSDKLLINCHRQAGKSTATSILAIHTALIEPGALTLIVSASQRQSGELFRKVVTHYKNLGSPAGVREDNATTLTLGNGSRIVSLPDSVDTIVGFSGPRLVIIDEAARVSDETFVGVRPMLTDSRGRMVAMSTPRGQRGWWHNAWYANEQNWERIEFRAEDNPRVDPAWLAEEQLILGPLWFSQEYQCQFIASDNQVFTTESINAAFDSDLEPLFLS
jgi:hypothetical protein